MKIAQESKDPLTWIVRGVNWIYEVTLDPEDADSHLEEQAIEAATKAVEIFHGVVPHNSKFVMDDPKEKPFLDIYLEVFLKDGNKDIGYPVFTYIALGNGGFYNEAETAFKALIEELYERQDEIENNKKIPKSTKKQIRDMKIKKEKKKKK